MTKTFMAASLRRACHGKPDCSSCNQGYVVIAGTAITYDGAMPRWEPDAAGRLHDAALALFTEQGYEQTTVAQIAERAGVSERTFFNHFANKRDVLFGQTSQKQKDVVAREIAACPENTPPLEAVLHGLQAAADEVLDAFRVPARPRREIIDVTPELQEREEGKRAALAATIASALSRRGTDEKAAAITAGLGLVVQQAAEAQWVRPDEQRPLRDLLAEALSHLRTIMDEAPDDDADHP
ncbi:MULTISPECIES: TetR/AcrR family transcriptional regulator [unclassified Streptomyces]|uniref:TetR/AcrR family transcriptional regulator n=1 Tax=unclassified Streptomyces TaxID=2593676 RepID=UPI001F228CC6|nr:MULTISPECIES: TetR/AcrR family transcriptional regulator [unclassified Streptomyces]